MLDCQLEIITGIMKWVEIDIDQGMFDMYSIAYKVWRPNIITRHRQVYTD